MDLFTPREGEDVVRAAHGPVRAPDVIVLTNYDSVHSRTVAFNRRNLFARDKNICQYCGRKFRSEDLSIDHVFPQCQGGRSTWDNCVLACLKCNVRKGGRTPKQAGMSLIHQPYKPKWSPTFRTRIVKPTWRKFLEAVYWDVLLKE
jgi:5-methylcytosine-specific restriction endonuclease McrA